MMYKTDRSRVKGQAKDAGSLRKSRSKRTEDTNDAVCSSSFRLETAAREDRSRGQSLRFSKHFGRSFFGWPFVRVCKLLVEMPRHYPAVSKRDSVFVRRRRISLSLSLPLHPRYSSGFSLTRVTGSWFIPRTRAGTCHNICIILELASSIFIFRNVHGVLNFISRLRPARPFIKTIFPVLKCRSNLWGSLPTLF